MVKTGERVRDASHRGLPSRRFVGPFVGVRKAGLASVHRASAHAPLGALYLEGSSACFGRMSASDGSDICPLGADGVGTTAIVPGI